MYRVGTDRFIQTGLEIRPIAIVSFTTSDRSPIDFSVILAVRVPGSNQLFRLRRYNGKSQEHSNRIEGVKFYDFHIHVATERYQELGTREDAYADPTDRYGDYQGALRCLIADANLEVPPDLQVDLFEEV